MPATAWLTDFFLYGAELAGAASHVPCIGQRQWHRGQHRPCSAYGDTYYSALLYAHVLEACAHLCAVGGVARVLLVVVRNPRTSDIAPLCFDLNSCLWTALHTRVAAAPRQACSQSFRNPGGGACNVVGGVLDWESSHPSHSTTSVCVRELVKPQVCSTACAFVRRTSW